MSTQRKFRYFGAKVMTGLGKYDVHYGYDIMASIDNNGCLRVMAGGVMLRTYEPDEWFGLTTIFEVQE